MKEVGKIVGVSEKTISRWEGSEAIPSLRNRNSVCRYLGIKAARFKELVVTPAIHTEGAANASA